MPHQYKSDDTSLQTRSWTRDFGHHALLDCSEKWKYRKPPLQVYSIFISCKVIFEKLFFKFFYIYLSLKKLKKKNIFRSIKNLVWFLKSVFLENLNGKHFLKVIKNLEISYYLLIISNLVLKLLIAIYIFCFEYLFFNFIS
jgi:hypothetical protein